jgi:hypothetical protein
LNLIDSDILLEIFVGKNTLESARILAETFVARFGDRWGTREDILKHLLPKGRANTWSDLDRHIHLFCRQFYVAYKEHSEKIEFFDQARFVIQDLPQKQDYKLFDGKEEYATPQDIAHHFVLCSLCWRSVARQVKEKKTPLCHTHDLPRTNPERRRRARMKGQVEEARLRLVKALPSLWELRQRQVDLTSYLQDLCLNLQGPLPYLASYLQSLSRPPLNLPLQTGREILQALEYPVYFRKIPPHIKEAWDCYLDDRSQHFRLNYVKILTAEAWLEVDAKRQHGGRRR